MLERFKEPREQFNYYMNHPNLIEQKLEEGEQKVEPIAKQTIQRVREVFKF